MLEFTEVQGFKRWWIALVVTLGLVVLFLVQEVTDFPLSIVPAHLIVPSLVTILLKSLRLEVIVDHEGISYRMFPLGKQMKRSWDEIRDVKVIPYVRKPSKQGLFFKINEEYGIIFRMGGTHGMLVTPKTGRKMFFGTQRPGELKTALEELAPKNIVTTTV